MAETPNSEQENHIVPFRATWDEHERWKQAAKRAGFESFSAWVRDTLEERAAEMGRTLSLLG